jgi:fumarate reductase flavoprotein subunit
MKRGKCRIWILVLSAVIILSETIIPTPAQTLDADIVVIGAGTAGLPAALTAAERGAKVIILEKSNATGGTGNRGMGLLAVESRMQNERQMALTKEQAFDIFMTYTHWRVDARLVQTYLFKSASTIDWLEKMGVQFVAPAAYFPGSYFTWHIVKNPEQAAPTGGAMAAALKILAEKARERGVQILLETPAKQILKEGSRITGVIGQDKSGKAVQVNAKAVIIAAGGFGDNPEMIKKYTHYEWGVDIFSIRIPGMTGDGIRMAWEAGAYQDLESMNMELITNIPTGASPALRQPRCIMVNLQGKRFYNEELLGNGTFAGNAIANQKNRVGFLIMDATIAKYYEENGADTVRAVGTPQWKIGNVEAAMTSAAGTGDKGLYVANSIDELSAMTGIDLAGLKQTITQYNEFCKNGEDHLFHKSHKYLMPVQQPKFFASKILCSAYGSLGGIKINEKTEVLTKDFEAIPGLYAAGVDANSLYGDSYVFYLPGNTMGFAVNSGRIAGENAAQYVGK